MTPPWRAGSSRTKFKFQRPPFGIPKKQGPLDLTNVSIKATSSEEELGIGVFALRSRSLAWRKMCIASGLELCVAF